MVVMLVVTAFVLIVIIMVVMLVVAAFVLIIMMMMLMFMIMLFCQQCLNHILQLVRSFDGL